MVDVHVYVNRPANEAVPALEELADSIRELGHVSEVRADRSGSVLAISFEGGPTEQEQIERAVRDAGYELQRLSVRGSSSPE